MGNFVFSNNGLQAQAEGPFNEELGINWPPARDADPAMKIIDVNGIEKIVEAGVSVGMPYGRYIIEVVE